MANPLQQLAEAGQSFWLDNLSRELIQSGELQSLIDNDGLRGITSNPTIFEKAFSSGSAYDDDIARLAAGGSSVEEIFEELAIADIRAAADMLRPVYDGSGRADGFVSLELPPVLANDTERSIVEAKRLFSAIDRPNVMIKVPGTKAGLPAIETLLANGVNINITLLFSLDDYVRVADAYISAMEKRQSAGKPLESVASVASFFVSRVDTEVDSRLERIIESSGDPQTREQAKALSGKVAIANARIAYQRFKERFLESDRFTKLAEAGARVQRPLWASTSTKNPDYPDTLYIEALIGPHTVETMAPASVDAFRDHGTVRVAIEDDLEGAKSTFDALQSLGIDYYDVTRTLQEKGVELFAESYDQLLSGLAGKVQQLEGSSGNVSTANLSNFEDQIEATRGKLESQQTAKRLLAGDASLWSENETVQVSISNRLGWVRAHQEMRARAAEFNSLSQSIRADGFIHAVLLGMGGSSLAPEVVQNSLGNADGYPELTVLDTTNPDTILRVRGGIDLDRTIFIVSSKSGGTVETATLMNYFWDEAVRELGDAEASRRFIAITDEGSALESRARELGFREVYLNASDIGGRYSALSYFGLVPAAVIGVDIAKLLEPVPDNDADIELGVVLATLARSGRDKLTFVLPDRISGIADWLEQLIAESTGKHGYGIVPISREPVAGAAIYGSDRVFVGVQLMSQPDRSVDTFLTAMESAGHPIVRISMPDLNNIAAEFYRWEVATAVAGIVLQINPFDEPNVQESKDNTTTLIEQYRAEGALPAPRSTSSSDAVVIAGGDPSAMIEPFRWFLNQIRLGDYLAILAFADNRPDVNDRLAEIRRLLRDRLGVATTLGHGPRYLHSIGQLYKGGPQIGAFLQIVSEPQSNLPIPGEDYPFEVLFNAQGLGDFQALQQRNRPVLRITTRGDDVKALDEIIGSVVSAAIQ